MQAPKAARRSMLKGGPRRMTVMEGLYSGLGDHAQAAAAAAAQQNAVDMKMAMLVDAPAAVEDALASLLDHQDCILQVKAYYRASLLGLDGANEPVKQKPLPA